MPENMSNDVINDFIVMKLSLRLISLFFHSTLLCIEHYTAVMSF